MNTEIILNNEKNVITETKKLAGRAVAISMLACAALQVLQIFISLVIPIPSDYVGYLYFMIFDYAVSIILPFFIISLIFKKLFPINDENRNSGIIKKPFLYISGALGTGYAVILLTNVLFPRFTEYYSVKSDPPPETAYGIFLLFVLQALLPAILEEWAFRGVICKNLLPYGRNGAIIISSLLFGLMHIDPPRIIFTTAIGIMLAICYTRTGSLWMSIVIHFANNVISTTASVYLDFENGAYLSLGVIVYTLLIYVFIGCSVAAVIYYVKNGLCCNKISLKKPLCGGYKLTVSQYLKRTVFNFGIIPLAIIYSVIYYLQFIYGK